MSARRLWGPTLVWVTLLAGGCYRHSQQVALARAGLDFEGNVTAIDAKANPRKKQDGTGTPDNSVAIPRCPTASVGPGLLTPWILGPDWYQIEGCGYQAEYRCTVGHCAMVPGTFRPSKPGPAPRVAPVRSSVSPGPSAPAVAGSVVPATAPAGDAARDTEAPVSAAPSHGGNVPVIAPAAADAALRAALNARRAEIAACVGPLPVAIQVTNTPPGPAAVSLRGALAGSPEEQCVRDVLKDVTSQKLSGPGTIIHVVR